MAYFLNLFTPETWSAFQEHGANISGFKYRQRRMARERIGQGDIFLCYLVRLSRWCGALEIVSRSFEDSSPIFGDPDPFVIRFRVKPLVLLKPERAIPIFDPRIWNSLSETRGSEIGSTGWTGYFRASLREIADTDGNLLLSLLTRQGQEQREFPFTDRDRRQLARKLTARTLDREVAVEVPDEDEDEHVEAAGAEMPPRAETRQSIQIQAKVAEIGAEMGFRIWVPRARTHNQYEMRAAI